MICRLITSRRPPFLFPNAGGSLRRGGDRISAAPPKPGCLLWVIPKRSFVLTGNWRRLSRERIRPIFYPSKHRDFPEYKDLQHQINPVVEEALTAHFLRTIEQVKQEIGLPLVLENFPYYSFWVHYKLCADPQFITRICLEGDCGFLLDLAHARCSAWSFQTDLRTYLNELPLDRVKEVHLAGVWTRAEGVIDTHTKLEEDDYVVLRYVLTKTDPEIITIEYGGMPDQIRNLHGEYEPVRRNDPWELREMIDRVRQVCF